MKRDARRGIFRIARKVSVAAAPVSAAIAFLIWANHGGVAAAAVSATIAPLIWADHGDTLGTLSVITCSAIATIHYWTN